jgi:hypothetical protein
MLLPCQSRTFACSARPRCSSRATAAATAPRCSHPSGRLAIATHSCWPPEQHICRHAPVDRKLCGRPSVVEGATLSQSMKLISWTSQPL